jgi:hypothetical protein
LRIVDITGTATERMRITSTGNVGIGTTSPGLTSSFTDRQLTLAATSASNRPMLELIGNYTTDTLVAGVSFHNDSSGSTANNKRIAQISALRDGGNNAGALSFLTHDSSTTLAERMRIDSAGNLLVGATSSPFAVFLAYFEKNQVNPTTFAIRNTNSGGASRIVLGNDGGAARLSIGYTGSTSTGYPSGASAGYIGTEASEPLGFQTNGIERMRIASSGELLTGGKTTVTANGGDVQVSSGISFPATQVAKSDPNTLDDYEEGTWTPVVADAATGGNTGTIASIQQAWYRKVGSLVTVSCSFTGIGTSGLASGNTLWIRGLPFAISGRSYGAVQCDNITFSDTVVSFLNVGNTAFFLATAVSGGAGSDLKVSAVTSGSAALFTTITYSV